MRLLLFSDLHLDTPFAWAPAALARARRRALRDTLSRIVALANTLKADALCSAGDLFEHDRFAPDTGEFLRGVFADTPCPVLLAPGNHDWFSRASLYAQTAFSPNVVVYTDDQLAPYKLTDGLTIWGAAHRAPANTDNFLDGFVVPGGGVHLGLFHGSERSGLVFQEDGKAPHAPFNAAQIPAAGLAHALVGHYHSPADAEWHTYPGNPDPLTFGETGVRGAVQIDVADDGTVTRTWHPVASTVVRDVTVDVTGAKTSTDIRDMFVATLTSVDGIVRATLTGEISPDIDVRASDLSGLVTHLQGLLVRVGKLRASYDLEAIAAERTVRGQFVRDVLGAQLPEDEAGRVLTTGLRALSGRTDLEVA